MNYRITINGTDKPPFPASWGMEVNPFPQIAKAEYRAAERKLAELGRRGTTPARIRELLADFDPQFVDMIVGHYQPGKLVKLTVRFPEGMFA